MPTEEEITTLILKHAHSENMRRYLILITKQNVKKFCALYADKDVLEYLEILKTEEVQSYLSEFEALNQFNGPKSNIPTEDEILNFDYPTITGCGHDEKIHSIVHELNRRNLNKQGYGFCLRCNGYHSYEFSKEFCLKTTDK